MHLTIPFIAGFIATTAAIQCLSPPAPNPLDICQQWRTCWSTVDTDPASFCIYLTNFGLGYPPHSVKVAGPVSRTAGCATIPGRCWPELINSPYRVRIAACDSSDTIFSECNQLTITQPCCPRRRSRIEGRSYDVDIRDYEIGDGQ